MYLSVTWHTGLFFQSKTKSKLMIKMHRFLDVDNLVNSSASVRPAWGILSKTKIYHYDSNESHPRLYNNGHLFNNSLSTLGLTKGVAMIDLCVNWNTAID